MQNADFWGVAPAPKRQVNAAKFSIEEIISLIAAYVMTKILDGLVFKSSDAFHDHPEFAERGLKKANAVGDALGVRGFSLYRTEKGHFEATFENGTRVLGTVKDHDQLAKAVGYESGEQLRLAVLKLGWDEFEDERRAEFVERLGFESVAALEEALDELPKRQIVDAAPVLAGDAVEA